MPDDAVRGVVEAEREREHVRERVLFRQEEFRRAMRNARDARRLLVAEAASQR